MVYVGKVPEIPKIDFRFFILFGIKLESPLTVTELNPSYPELGVTTCVLLLGVIDFDYNVGELPLDFTCIDTLFWRL